MKKQLTLLLLVILPMVALADKKGKCGDDIRWTYVTATRTLTLSGSGPMKHYSFHKEPWNSFRGDIQTLIIEEGITSISSYAFDRCGNLTSVTLPKSLKIISSKDFSGCSSLTSINIPNGVTSIGSGAFFGCKSLTSITIPNSVKTIGEYNQEIKGETNVEIIPVSA